MPRARNIKPGFFSNDQLVELPFETRLLFIGLWTIADRDGRIENRPKKIKIDIFPGDDVDCGQCLQQLEEREFILRYQADGKQYIQIQNWHKHQSPHVKEAASTIPAPDKYRTSTILASEQLDTKTPDCGLLIADSGLLIPDSEVSNDTSRQHDAVPPCECTDDKLELKPKTTQCPHEELVSLFREICPELPPVEKLSAGRKSALNQRWRHMPDKRRWAEFFTKVHESDFLMGKVERNGSIPFVADFSWLIKEENFLKVLEGKYSTRVSNSKLSPAGEVTKRNIESWLKSDNADAKH